MRRAPLLVLCVLTLAFAFPAVSQTPSTTAVFTTASCGKPVCTWNAFGPQTFTRQTGKPETLTASFGIRNPNTQYTMVIQNKGVASAIISLNGAQVFGPSDFNPNVSTLQKSVSLQQGANTLSVELRSKPGATLTITVIGVDTDPPGIAYAEDPFPNQYGWNNSNVTLTFSCADQTSGVAFCSAPFTLTTEGLNQTVSGKAIDLAGNSTAVSVPVSIDKTPPTIRPSVNPAPNSAGWNNSDVTVSFACADTLSGIATCASPVTVSSEGAGQVVSGSAADRAGNTAQATATLNVDKTPPSIAISSPSSGANVTSPTLTVTGAASDSLSGLAAITCSGAPAIVNAGSFSCNISLTPGVNNIVVGATDNAGNAATTTVSVTYSSALNPPPTALFLTPDHFAMIVSETRKLALVDDLGRAIPTSGWTVSDPTVAQTAPDGTITALAAGKATVTGAYQNLTATAELTVYAPQALKAGTVRWSVQPLPGNTLLKVYPGQPTGPDDPGVYFVEKSGSKLVVRALTTDGRQKWVHTILPTLGTTPIRGSRPGSVSLQNISTAAAGPGTIRPHRWGKQITEFMNQVNGQSNPSVASLSKGARLQPAIFKPSAGAWKVALAKERRNAVLRPVQSGGSSVSQTVLASATTDAGNQVINSFEMPQFARCTNSTDNIIVLDAHGNELWRHSIVCGEMGFALHPDGIVYILQADYNNNSTFTLFAQDELTGATKFSIQLPFSFGGQLQPFPGLPSVLPDGNLYLPVETLDAITSPDVLRLLKVSPDGSYSWLPVATATPCYGPVIEAHEALPDGQGGVLVTWDYFGGSFTLCNGNASVQLVRMSSSGQVLGSNQLPLGSGSLPSYFSDNDGDAVLGEQHLFVTDGRQSVGFNLSTSSIDLNWQTAPCAGYPCPKVSLAGVAAGDQLIVNQTGNSDGSSTLFALTPTSNSCPTICFTETAVPNATLVAFDFSGFFSAAELRASETLTSTGDFFCLCVLAPALTPSTPAVFGGAVTAPDANATPKPQQRSAWSTVAEDGTRDSLIVVKTRVSKVIEADVNDDFIRKRVNTAATYWRNKARISLNWDGKINAVSACAPDRPTCDPMDPASRANILSVTRESDADEVRRRFQQPKGVDFVFVYNTGTGGFNTDAGTPIDKLTGKYTNVVIISKTARDVLAHEVGHVFQLPHERYKPFNLMFGDCPALSQVIPCLFLDIAYALSSASALDEPQREKARANAFGLQ